MHKYDLDTLTSLGDLTKYDYFVLTSGNEEMLPQVVAGSNACARILVLGLPDQGTSKAAAPQEKVVSIPAATQGKVWKEAIRLVHTGAINLEDHTVEIESLEDYCKAWAGVETGERFKVLLSMGNGMEAL